MAIKLLMEGLGGVVAPLGPTHLMKSPDGGSTLVPLTESDINEFRRGNLYENVSIKDKDGNATFIPRSDSFLSESRGSDGFLYIVGPMFRCDAKNGNGRIYERGIWEGVRNNKVVVENIAKGGSKGHLEHPKDGKTDLNLVSHIMVPYDDKSVFAINEDGIGHGKARILNTTSGKQLQELYKGGACVGFSSRGKGSTYKRGSTDYVAKDYQFDTFDAVASPSVAEATPGLEEKSHQKSRYSLASRQQESINYSTEATYMMNTKDTLGQLEDNLKKIAGSLEESNDVVSLASLRETLLDQQLAIRSVVESDPTARDVTDELASKAKELRAEVTTKMENLQDKSLDEAIRKTTSSLTEAKEGSDLKDVLRETKNRLDYYRAACEELVESDDYVTRKEYEAAVVLAEALTKKCKEFQADKEELAAALKEALEAGQSNISESTDLSTHPDYQMLEARYEKALLIIEELTGRIRGAQVHDRVEEVIRIEPRFARIRDDLLECKTVNELNNRVDRLARLLEGGNETGESLTEAETLEILSSAFDSDVNSATLMDINEDISVAEVYAPQARLSERQTHRMNLIGAICRTEAFRK